MTREALPVGAGRRRLDRVGGGAETPVVLGIHVEPDLRVLDHGDPDGWRGFERCIEPIQSLRERLSELSGAPVAFTWFVRMDPQVEALWGTAAWAVETYRDTFAELEASGDELGLHTHDWRWDDEAGEWFADHDPAWGEHCVTTALDAFEMTLGRPCGVHSGGDQFLSGAMLSRLAARGVRADLTVEPGMPPHGPAVKGERARGLTPDYRAVPARPYRSSPASFPAPDPTAGNGPLLIPAFSAPGIRGRRSPLRIWTRPHGLFALRLAAELRRDPPRVLYFAVRTGPALHVGWDPIVRNLEHLARRRQMRFVTASAAAERLAGQSADASSGLGARPLATSPRSGVAQEAVQREQRQ